MRCSFLVAVLPLLASGQSVKTGLAERQIAGDGTVIEAKHARLILSASAPAVSPGERVKLGLDIDLPPKMHAYAPGAKGFVPIDWQMEENAVQLSPFQYPPPQIVRLKAVNATAPVYRGRVQMTREVTFRPENALKPLAGPDGVLVLKGSFEYQACNDRRCYLPETVPLEWRFRLER